MRRRPDWGSERATEVRSRATASAAIRDLSEALRVTPPIYRKLARLRRQNQPLAETEEVAVIEKAVNWKKAVIWQSAPMDIQRTADQQTTHTPMFMMSW